MTMPPRPKLVAVVLAVALLGFACGGDDEDDGGGATGDELVGTFAMAAGECGDAGVSAGSWFRMVQPGGTVDAGPFVVNGDSPCTDKTWTPLSPGSDGGLRTGETQPNPDPAFDASGNALATRITQPTKWFAVTFGLATNDNDPQTGADVRAPEVRVTDGKLSGDLRAFAAAWNGQHFNQGAPKPDGSRPGGTVGPTGTYDEATDAYTLDWSSQIEGGPFDNFVGVWHLEGAFTPAGD